MRLTLGATTYELATRPLVIGVLDANVADAVADVPEAAKALVALGADIVQVEGDAADLVEDPGSAGSGAAVVVRVRGVHDLAARREALVRRAHEVEAAGIPPERVVVDPGLDEAPELLGQARRFAELGYPLLVRASGAAEIALAVTGGCRLVMTHDVPTARRVCDVLAAILEARP
ncbi:MAG: hypothetical protein ACRD12_17010 [Acidimicrobiales bacterium]